MGFPSVRTEVRRYEDTDGGTVVDVEVDALERMPDEFMELRARGRALAATGFATSAPDSLSEFLSAELGEIDRFTETLEVNDVEGGKFHKSKEYTVMVDTPF